MSPELLTEIIRALDEAGPGGVVHAAGFVWGPAYTDRLARRLGARMRVVSVTDPLIPAGGLWLTIARALGAEGSGDPRRRARRVVAEGLRDRQGTVLVVGEADRLPAPSLASLLATTEVEPGLRLLLLAPTEDELATPLPANAVAARPPLAVPRREAAAPGTTPTPTPPARPTRARPGSSRPEPVAKPHRTDLPRQIAVAVLLVGMAAWWLGSGDDFAAGLEGPSVDASPAHVAAAPRGPLPHNNATESTAPTPPPEPAIQPLDADASIPAPADPTDSADSVDPTDPLDPVDSVDPADPVDPVDPIDLVDSADAADADSAELAEADPLSGPINVNAEPWAMIDVDGRRIGETPIGNLRLPRGRYDIRAIFPDGSWLVRRVIAGKNEEFVSFRR